MNLIISLACILTLITILIISVILIDKKIIPKLNKDSKFLKWWERNVIVVDEEHI
jgi:hypothetical protein